MGAEIFEARAFTRLDQLQYLLRTQQIDERFYWTPQPGRVDVQDSGL